MKFYQKLSKTSPKNEQSKNLYITINDSKILRIHHDTVRLSVLTNFNNHHHQTKRVADPKTIYNQVIKLLVIQSLGYKFHDEKKLNIQWEVSYESMVDDVLKTASMPARGE